MATTSYHTAYDPAAVATTPETLSDETVRAYRRDGFIKVPGVIGREEALAFRDAALDFAARLRHRDLAGGSPDGVKMFNQFVNAWQEDEALRQLTLHPNVAAVARRLAGVPLRLWHDQILIKQPGKNVPTEFHQDQPYWPHAYATSRHPLSCWIALGDVPVERGCMTFIPGSQSRTDLAQQNAGDPRDLFAKSPDLTWEPRVTLPLRAGDCTFHHARTAHMATANLTDEPRVAHVIIFMDAGTTYERRPHPLTDPLGLEEGQVLGGDLFPLVAD